MGWRLAGVGLIVLAAKKAKKRTQRAREVYLKEVASGAKPIEGVSGGNTTPAVRALRHQTSGKAGAA
jgi:hypothetical protein